MNRLTYVGLRFGLIAFLLLSINVNCPFVLTHFMQVCVNVISTIHKGRFRFTWINPRLEEAFDCIRRLPPPGNTRQLRITSFFEGRNPANRSLSQRLNAGNRSNSTISIMQWNAQSLTEPKSHELAVLASETQMDVLCVSELGHRRTIPGYRAVITSSTGTQSGIFCRSSLPAETINIPDLAKFEDQGILSQVSIIDTSFYLIHIYIAPRVSISVRKTFWESIASFVIRYNSQPIIITGDLNTKSPEISENHTSERHSYFSSFLEKTDMHIINDSTPTRGMNTLDVTIANEHFHRDITNWQVLDQLDSDHLPTITETSFKASTAFVGGFPTIYKYLNVQSTLNSLKNELNSKGLHSRNLSLEEFHKLIQQNQKYKTSHKAGSAIWTEELTHLKRARNKARKRLRLAQPSQIAARQQERDRLRKEHRSAFKKAKTRLQQQQAESIAHQKTSAQAWRLTKLFVPAARKKPKKWCVHSESAITQANNIADIFAQISADESIELPAERQLQLDRRIFSACCKSSSFKPVTMRELKSSIKLSNVNSASGADGISVRLLKAITEDPELGPLLRDLFTNVLITSEFPDTLKIAKIRAIPKQAASQHRPISLLPNLGKLLERIITTRIREQICTQFHDAQQGCRSGHGTSTAITRLLHYSGIAAADHKHFGFITFDFSKAYDRVNRSILLSKLVDLNVEPYLISVVDNWLQNRKFFVSHRGSNSDEQDLPNGIPQGSALSVLLWLVYVNDIDIDANASNIYVDDVIVWASGPTRSSVLNQLQSMATRVIDWSDKNRVKINFDKTHLLINGHDLPCSIRVGDHILKNEQRVRYLGVDFLASPFGSDSSLNYDLRAAAGNIKRRCAILKPLRRLGFSQHHISIVVNGYVGGKLRYYTPWLGTDIQPGNESNISPLIKAYNQMMRIKCNAICTTPIPLLHAGSRMPLLSSIIKRDSTRMILSSVASNNLLGREYLEWYGFGDGWTPLGCTWRTLRHSVPDSYNTIQNQLKPTLFLLEQVAKCKFKIGEDRETALKLHSQNSLLRPSPDLEVWTDGSYENNTNRGGTAVVVTELTQKCVGAHSRTPHVTEEEEVEIGVQPAPDPSIQLARGVSQLSFISRYQSQSRDDVGRAHTQANSQNFQNSSPILRSRSNTAPESSQYSLHNACNILCQDRSLNPPSFDEPGNLTQTSTNFSSFVPSNEVRDTSLGDQLEHQLSSISTYFQGSRAISLRLGNPKTQFEASNCENMQTSTAEGAKSSQHTHYTCFLVPQSCVRSRSNFRDPHTDVGDQAEFGSYVEFVTSSYDVEVEAMLEALKYLIGKAYKQCEIAVYSDCRGLVSQLEALILAPKMVDETIHTILTLLAELVSGDNQIYLTWIPSHVGIEGNERADKLAKENLVNATCSDNYDPRIPRLANYDLFLRKMLEIELDEYLNSHVKPSSQSIYPSRDWFRGKIIQVGNKAKVVYPYKLEEFDAPFSG